MNAIYPHTKIETASDLATVQDHPDAAFLALRRELDESYVDLRKAVRAERRALKKAKKLGDHQEAMRTVGFPALWRVGEKIKTRIFALERRILDTPSESLFALVFKLRTAAAYVDERDDDLKNVAILAACRDAERLAGLA